MGDLVGLKQKTISAFENKPESIKLSTVLRILSALNLDIRVSPKKELDSKASQ
ncbi:helix-turn-helix domain-containing protein [Legionella yabuuchiae]|uniref:helix-turn-helix domain-containing protein n=1 Tax=Legionella yabuuchiae TaxID=376727 RepID=UPI001F5FCE03|nr:helix-turn-helix domain-containing protein [Legionella yabuuchiae]